MATVEAPTRRRAEPRPASTSSTRGAAKLAAWTLGFVPVLYLALRGGGYDLVIRSQVGLIAWWVVLLGVVIGLLPLQRLGRLGWVAVGLLGAFALWTGIAAAWSQSAESSVAEFSRVLAYLGFFVLALCVIRRDAIRPLLAGIAVAIGVVSGLAVLSRVQPSLVHGNQVALLIGRQARLTYPLNYANGTGEFVAIGIPLLLMMATSGRTLAGRALAAAGVPAAVLALVLTVSRGGILAAGVAAVAFYALAPDRLPKLGAALPPAVGSVILVKALLDRIAVRNNLATTLAASQRHELTFLVLAVCTGVAAAQVLIDLAGRQDERPSILRVSRREARRLTITALSLAVAVAVAAGATGQITHYWRIFQQPVQTAVGAHNVYSRLGTTGGSNLYQYWVAALHAFQSRPLSGIGPATFQFYWAQHAPISEFVLNGHSLYLETLAETGAVGFLLITGLLLVLLGTGVRRAFDQTFRSRTRTALAAATAALLAFCVAAGLDWVWQLPAIVLVALLLGVAILAPHKYASSPPPGQLARRRTIALRGAAGLAAALAIVAIAIPYAATVAVRSSQAEVRAGRLAPALDDAATAGRLQPYAATPLLQRALILEQAGDLAGAQTAIVQATTRAPTDSGIWLIRARIDAERGQAAAAAADYRRAHALNPRSETTSL